MSDKDKQDPEQYPIQDSSEGDPPSQDPAKRPAHIERPDDVEPVELEPEDKPNQSAQKDDAASDSDEPAKPGVRELDICPNCGAPMREGNRLVCLRCGFDLKTLQVLKTETGEQVEEEDDEEDEPPEPLSLPGRGDYMVPGIMAGLSVLLISIGYFANADGLHLQAGNDPLVDPAAVDRFAKWGEYLAYLVLGSMCALASLFIVARLNERPFGDWRLGMVRTVGIIATVWLAKFLNLGDGFFEFSFEWILHGGIFVGLSMFFFRLMPRDAATAGLTALLLVLAFRGLAAIIT